MYIAIRSAACRCHNIGAAEYLATARTALGMSSWVWFTNHMKCPTNDIKGSSTFGSSMSKFKELQICHPKSTLATSDTERRHETLSENLP